ncbi:MAG: NAD(P)-dependent oxidoreductase [Pirellulales bacterium]
MRHSFRVSFTADFYDEGGKPRYRDYGATLLVNAHQMEVCRIEAHRAEIAPEQIEDVQGVIVLSPRVTARTLSDSQNLLVVSRFGVGYDGVDVVACTEADVLLTIARGAVDRSVAEATVGWMIALTHHMLVKDRLVREGRWADRSFYMGSELRDRTLGVIGFGGIGRALVRLLSGFSMKTPLVFDPHVDHDTAASQGVQRVDLESLLAEADFVSVNCPLTNETINLIGSAELGSMKPSAFLINTARGGIVDEDALFNKLSARAIAGAAIDCFDGEPLVAPHRFGALDNVLLAPHSIAWTHEMFRDIGRVACQGMLDVACGRRPHGVINPEVFDRPRFRDKWNRLRIADVERHAQHV